MEIEICGGVRGAGSPGGERGGGGRCDRCIDDGGGGVMGSVFNWSLRETGSTGEGMFSGTLCSGEVDVVDGWNI